MEKRPQYSIRTKGFPDDVFEHLQSNLKDRSFREYVLELIEKDMQQEFLLNQINEKMNHFSSVLMDEMNNKFDEMNDRIDKIDRLIRTRTMVGVNYFTGEQEEDIKEGQVLSSEIVTKDTLDTSMYEFDF